MIKIDFGKTFFPFFSYHLMVWNQREHYKCLDLFGYHENQPSLLHVLVFHSLFATTKEKNDKSFDKFEKKIKQNLLNDCNSIFVFHMQKY